VCEKVAGFSEGRIFLFLWHVLFGAISFVAEELPLAALPIIFRCAFRHARFLFMQKIGFAEALESVVGSDPRYQRDGYIFLRDALDFTTKQQKKVKGVSVRHVTGPELLDGVRQYALKEFGPMVMTVFDSWGIRSCEDFGHMVFNLIGVGVFGKTEQDSIEDFKNVYDFEEAFVKPFAPAKPETVKPVAQLPASKPATSSN
jgi:uncharacterized repeat protein (TIGR04138 family)